MWLTNPSNFDPEIEVQTINGDEVIEPTPPEFEVIEHQNGNETLIHYKLKAIDEDDEKVEV